MLQAHLAAALTSMKWYHMLFLQSDAGEVRRRAARKGPRSNNSPTKGLLTSPGTLPDAVLNWAIPIHATVSVLAAMARPQTGSCLAPCVPDHLVYTVTTSPIGFRV